jgi:uncharacterized protein YecT (DUF1311 family)
VTDPNPGRQGLAAFFHDHLLGMVVFALLTGLTVNYVYDRIKSKEFSQNPTEIVKKNPNPLPPVSLQPSKFTRSEISPSFNCTLAKLIVERLICSNPSLAHLDVEMADAYSRLWAISNDREPLRAAQLAWLSQTRNVCSTIECLTQIYTERIRELQGFAEALR